MSRYLQARVAERLADSKWAALEAPGVSPPGHHSPHVFDKICCSNRETTQYTQNSSHQASYFNMGNFDSLESQPLATHAEGDDNAPSCSSFSSSSSSSSSGTRDNFYSPFCNYNRNKRNSCLEITLFLALVLSTGTICGIVGRHLGQASRDLDSECALHTTQYCKYHMNGASPFVSPRHLC